MIGLALSGGSVKGAYEVGVYKAFVKCHIKFDGFVGTSIGSFNAAMLAAGKGRELIKFWRNVNVAELLNLDEKFLKALNDKHLKDAVIGIKQIITDKGINTIGLKEILEKFNIEESIRNSIKDFGLVTVRIKPLKAMRMFKEDIPKGKLNEYILGSCYLPIFKPEKIIDKKYYADGGFIDNLPVNMLLDKNYEKVYAVDLGAIGIKQKIKDKSKVVIIKPSHDIGGQFVTDKEKINHNIDMGYFDTLKLLKNLDGKKYIFKKEKDKTYERMIKNISSRRIAEIKHFFHTQDIKKCIILATEYFMLKDSYEYNKIYSIKKVIKTLRKTKRKPNGIYWFIRDLKI